MNERDDNRSLIANKPKCTYSNKYGRGFFIFFFFLDDHDVYILVPAVICRRAKAIQNPAVETRSKMLECWVYAC